MKQYCFTVECNSNTHNTVWVTREFKYLVGKQCPEGSEFIQAVGLSDNFTVANGQNTAAWATKSRIRLLEASKRLLERVQQDRNYIGYDYQVGFSAEGPRRHSGRGFGVRLIDRNGFIWLHPGQIYMELGDRGHDRQFHITEVVDLRKSGPIPTQSLGLLKVYRRSNPINWEQKLPALIEFLNGCSSDLVRVRHHYPED